MLPWSLRCQERLTKPAVAPDCRVVGTRDPKATAFHRLAFGSPVDGLGKHSSHSLVGQITRPAASRSICRAKAKSRSVMPALSCVVSDTVTRS